MNYSSFAVIILFIAALKNQFTIVSFTNAMDLFKKKIKYTFLLILKHTHSEAQWLSIYKLLVIFLLLS